MSNDILRMALNCHFNDIKRYKSYSKSEYANEHKQAAYTMKWLSKLSPIQLKHSKKTIDKKLIWINCNFALFVGMAFLDKSVWINMPDNIKHHLSYTMLYRNVSGRQFSGFINLLDLTLNDNKKKE